MQTAPASLRPSRERGWARSAGVAFALVLSVNRARAAGETVAFAHPESSDGVVTEITTRLGAELAAAGFDVEDLVIPADTDPENPVDTTALPRPPRATILFTTNGGEPSVDIWAPDPSTHELFARHVEVPPVARQRAPSALAVRTVELLRATLLGGAPSEPVRKPEPKPAPPPVRDREPSRDGSAVNRLALGGELGAAMLYGGNGISPAFAPLLRFFAGTKTWGGRLAVVAPAFGGEASAAGGKATLREELASIDATATWPAEGPVAVVGSAGGGAYHWHVSGKGTGINQGHEAERWGALAEVGAGALIRFGARFGLLVDAQAIWLAPPLTVRIVGTDAARSGQPTLCAGLGLWVAP